MAQNYFDTGFGVTQPDTTGARGSDSGTQIRFDNLLTPPASFTLSTGAPGTAPRATVVDAGTTASATDVFGHLNGTDAPRVTGSTGTSQPTGLGALGTGVPNPTSTGAGEGHVTNGSERLGR